MRQTDPPLPIAYSLESLPEVAPGCGHKQYRCVAPRDVENGLGAVLTAGVEHAEGLVEDLGLKDRARTKISEGRVVAKAGTIRHPCVSRICHVLTAC